MKLSRSVRATGRVFKHGASLPRRLRHDRMGPIPTLALRLCHVAGSYDLRTMHAASRRANQLVDVVRPKKKLRGVCVSKMSSWTGDRV